jgi:hypothetical protein
MTSIFAVGAVVIGCLAIFLAHTFLPSAPPTGPRHPDYFDDGYRED